MAPKGTIIFDTVGRLNYGFDIFSISLSSSVITHDFIERRLTDGISVNFNGHFVDESQTLAFVSERSGSAQIFLKNSQDLNPSHLPQFPNSVFHDRPILRNGRLYFVSAHEPPDKLLNSSAAVYSSLLDDPNSSVRLTPPGAVDYSPAVSQTGKFVAVASYGSRPWEGDFHELKTEVVVFPASDSARRAVVCKQGGWPSWSGDSTVFFHRVAADGWWSVFRLDLPERIEDLSGSDEPEPEPRRITPPGVHAFTPAASHNGKWIAVATRRPGTEFRHIEIFDLESNSFIKITEPLNPNFHHYNPFFSPESGFLGYHRFRGESGSGESTIPHLNPVTSPVKELRLLRLNGSFPSVSPNGDLIAFNHDFDVNPGVQIVRSDGSKRWTVMKGRPAFLTVWSPTEPGVIYTSVGPIFQTEKTTVQIARITFDLKDLDERDEIPAEVKILTREDSGNNAFPSCSPDGKHLVFRSGRTGHKNLYVVDAVNGELNGGIRQLTDGPWIDTMPSWSPDGKLIAFSSNRHDPDNVEAFSVYLVRPDGTEVRRVHVAGGDDVDRERINHVCFSPDSSWLLFTANLGGVSAEPVSLPNHYQPYGELFVARVDGSGAQRLTWNAYEDGTPAWREDGELEPGAVGDKLKGEFQEPLWITCDI